MKVILVNGGPHKEGCTYTALREVADALEQNGVETEIFWLGNDPVAGCIDCGYCKKTDRCFRNDTPVHFASAAGALISFLDRAFYGRDFSGKVGAAVISCRRAGATATFDEINKYFAIEGMPIVTSSYWNMVHGNTPEEVKQDLEGMQTMRILGKNMAWLLKCIEAGKQTGVPAPEKEEKIWTNFVR